MVESLRLVEQYDFDDIARKLKAKLKEMDSFAQVLNFRVYEDNDNLIVTAINAGGDYDISINLRQDIIRAMAEIGYPNADIKNTLFRSDEIPTRRKSIIPNRFDPNGEGDKRSDNRYMSN